MNHAAISGCSKQMDQLTQSHRTALRNSKENSYGWSEVIREETNQSWRIRQDGKGKKYHIAPCKTLQNTLAFALRWRIVGKCETEK